MFTSPTGKRLGARLLSLFIGFTILGSLALWPFTQMERPVRPPLPFPESIQGKPGELLVRELLPGAPSDSTAWRILYLSTGRQGEAILVSGVVIVPRESLNAPIIAWAHPTVGISTDCAPSRGARIFETIPGLKDFLDQGWIITATDYPGLGTPGPHPYLVGEIAGRVVLDSVRAVRQISPTASARCALWGHSQGGHAVLFAGQIAKDYAPELSLTAIAAAAPPTDLPELFAAPANNPLAKMLCVFTLWSWSEMYDIPLKQTFSETEIPAAKRIVETCARSFADLWSITDEARLFSGEPLVGKLKEGRWEELLRLNSPGNAPMMVPVMVIQGTKDTIVLPRVTKEFVKKLRDRGEEVRYEKLRGTGHLTAAKESSPKVAEWLSEQFLKD